MSPDQNLLFGVLAFQDDFIDLAQLAAVCRAWAAEKTRPLAELLVERGWISTRDREELERRVGRKLKRYGGDVHATLGAVAGVEARDALRAVDDPAVHQSISSLPPIAGHVLVETMISPAQEHSRYTLTRIQGEGGLGRVWVARDRELNREVALKELQPRKAGHPEAWRRFLKEAQITGQLEHPNIVPIYDLDRRPQDNQPFYTMRFVRGETLKARINSYHANCANHRGVTDPLELSRLLHAFVSVCHAVAYAHSRGVVHRDLKPENVVLGGFGEVIVLDWGLAKFVTATDPDSSTLGISADAETAETLGVLGTPAYMAPEQAEARSDRVDVRTDVYGVGSILFAILSGRAPHHGKDTAEILQGILTKETPRARSVKASVPRALDAICAKAMAKDRAQRYAQASELADDIQCWLADQPVTAYAEPRAARLGRWVRRHRTWTQAAALALSTIAVGAVVAVLLINHQRREAVEARDDEANQRKIAVRAREAAEKARGQEAAARRRAEETLVRNYVSNGARLLDEGDYFGSLVWFAEALRRDPGDADSDAIAVHRLRVAAVLRQCPKLHRFWCVNSPITAAEFSPDGSRVGAAVGYDGLIWNMEGADDAAKLLMTRSSVSHVAFSPDARFVVTTSESILNREHDVARVWDAATGEAIGPELKHDHEVRFACFSPNSRFVVTTCGKDQRGYAQVWDAFSSEPVGARMEHAGDVIHAAFSPDGRRVATASRYNGACVWEVETGNRLCAAATMEQEWVYRVRFSPNGDQVALASGGGYAQIFDSNTGEPSSPRMTHTSIVHNVAFSSDGKRLATASEDATARVWNVATGQPVTLPMRHALAVDHVEFSADGLRIATASKDHTARLWDASSGTPLTPPLRHAAAVTVARFNPDERLVMTAGSDKAIRVWDVSTALSAEVQLHHRRGVLYASFSPDGRRLVTGGADNVAVVWDAALGKPIAKALEHAEAIRFAVFSPNSRFVATASADRTARVWDAESGEPITDALPHEHALNSVIFSHDGRWIVTACGFNMNGRGAAQVWDARSGEPVTPPLRHRDGVSFAEFSPDDAVVLTSSPEGARMWSVATGEPIEPLIAQSWLHHATFSRDGQLIATATVPAGLVWDRMTGKALSQSMRHHNAVGFIDFSRDGRRVVTVGDDNAARIWSVPAGEPVTPRIPHRFPVSEARFSPDGRLVVTVSNPSVGDFDGTAQVWDANTGEPVSPPLRHRRRIMHAEFSPDSRQVVTSGNDNVAQIWRLQPDDRPADELVRLFALLSGHLIDGTRGFAPADTVVLQNAWRELKDKYPEEFRTPSHSP